MIDYSLIQKSIDYYQMFGFNRVESPWTVSQYVDDITRPLDRIPFELNHNGKRLVASGEQSFLYLYLKGFLPKGQFQTVTPCFRNESFDNLHTKYFIKNELIKTDIINNDELKNVISICFDFYQQFFNEKLFVVKTIDGFDITINGIELGSYGIRSCDYLSWIYATGCAEPRLSTLINKFKK